MNRDIIARKRPYEPVDIPFDSRLDQMLEKRWTFGTCVIVFVISGIGIAFMIALGNMVLGLN
jgi:hypothetical protein